MLRSQINKKWIKSYLRLPIYLKAYETSPLGKFCGWDFNWLSISMDGGGDGVFFSFLGEVFFQRKEEITTICSCIPLCLPELWISSRILWCHCSFLAITQEFIGYFTLMFKKIHTNVKWNQMKYPMNYWVMAKNVCYGHHCEVSVMLTSDLWPPNSNQFILKS